MPEVSASPPKPAPKTPLGGSKKPPLASLLSWVLPALFLAGVWAYQALQQNRGARNSLHRSLFAARFRQGRLGHADGAAGPGKAQGGREGRRAVDHDVSFSPARDRRQAFLPLLRDKGVAVTVKSEEPSALVSILSSVLPWVLIFGAWVWMSRRAAGAMAAGPMGRLLAGRSSRVDPAVNVAKTKFDDVAVLQSAKRDLHEIVEFLKTPEYFRRLGGKVPRGILLVGPPGTGKTLLARAVAGEAGVPFFSIGQRVRVHRALRRRWRAKRVRDLFEQAKQVSPAIVFIDEIDAVGPALAAEPALGGGNDEREQTLNQLLAEIGTASRRTSHDRARRDQSTGRPRSGALAARPLRPARGGRPARAGGPEIDPRGAQPETSRSPPTSTSAPSRPCRPDSRAQTSRSWPTRRRSEARAARATSIDSGSRLLGEPIDKIVLGGSSRDQRLRIQSGERKERGGRSRVRPRRHGLLRALRGAAGSCEHHSARNVARGHPADAGSRPAPPGAAGARGTTASAHMETGTRPSCRWSSGPSLRARPWTTFRRRRRSRSRWWATLYGMSERVGPVFHEHRTHAAVSRTSRSRSKAHERLAQTVHAIEEETRRMLNDALVATRQLLTAHRPALDDLVRELLEHETLEKSDLAKFLHRVAPDAAAVNAPALSTPSE